MAHVDERAVVPARQLCSELLDVAGHTIVGIYVHGSAVLGDFVPHVSDLDVLVVVEDDQDHDSIDVVAATLAASDASPAVGVEASVVARASAAHPRTPWPYLVHVTSSLADAKVVDGRRRKGDDDLILHYSVAREHGWSLFGPPSADVFGVIDRKTVVAQLAAELRWAASAAPESYAVLNACRALRFLSDGVLCSKLDGGEWATSEAIEPALVGHAIDVRRQAATDSQVAGPAAREWLLSVARALDC